MKYIDAERLKAEIEKPKNELKVGNYYLDNSEQAVGYENALMDFELLIDSLQQEQPLLPSNLDEAAEEYADETYYAYPPEFLDFVKDEIKGAFIAGAKWQAAHTSLPEDTVLFNKGVAEGKRLMLEDAVEYEVMDFSSSLETHPFVSIPLDNKKYRFGDKVRVIVLKTEEE